MITCSRPSPPPPVIEEATLPLPLPPPPKIIGVGDNFPYIYPNHPNVQKWNCHTFINGIIINDGQRIGGKYEFYESRIELKDRTVYVIEGKCIIDFSTGTGIIEEGEIKVYTVSYTTIPK